MISDSKADAMLSTDSERDQGDEEDIFHRDEVEVDGKMVPISHTTGEPDKRSLKKPDGWVSPLKEFADRSARAKRMMPEIKTIQVDEVLTIEAQRTKLGGNCLILINDMQSRIALAGAKTIGPVEASQIMERTARVYETIMGSQQQKNQFNFISCQQANVAERIIQQYGQTAPA